MTAIIYSRIDRWNLWRVLQPEGNHLSHMARRQRR